MNKPGSQPASNQFLPPSLSQDNFSHRTKWDTCHSWVNSLPNHTSLICSTYSRPMREHISFIQIFFAAINSLTNSSQCTKTIWNQKSDRRVICFDETRPIETMHGASQLKYYFIDLLWRIPVSIRGVEPLSERYFSEQEDVNYGLHGLLLGKDRVRFRLAEVWWRICPVDLRHILHEGPRKPCFELCVYCEQESTYPDEYKIWMTKL